MDYLCLSLGKILERVVKCDGSFSAIGCDLPSIALIVFHHLEGGSDLWSSVSTNCLHDVHSLLFICCRPGELGSQDLRSSHTLIFSNISAGPGSVLR